MKYKVTIFGAKVPFSLTKSPAIEAGNQLENYLNGEESPIKDGWRLISAVPAPLGMFLIWEKE